MRTRLGVAAASALALMSSGAWAAYSWDDCLKCHEPVASLAKGSKHEGVDCAKCHTGLDAHRKEQTPATRPGTDMSWQSCGGCHEDQMKSSMQMNMHRPARDEKSQLTNRAPNPFWDKLLAPHGFTKEHALTRSHTWAVVDHLLVDRAYGGRFQPKDGWQYVADPAGKKAWDYLKDADPSNNEQKAFLPQTATAANPTCMQCKTQDQILDWPYLGDPASGAKLNRASNPVEFARTVNYSLNCHTCHDPHGAKPRIVRDAMIQALTRPEADTLWHKDPKHTNFKVIDMGLRGFPRKIAILDKPDSRLQCGQCHMEYACGGGIDPKTNEKVTLKDNRTNLAPMKDVLNLYDFYMNQVSFTDFAHRDTGALLVKLQHPEVETFYESKHSKNGVGCDDCHMAREKNPKTGKEYTSHFAVTPRYQTAKTCAKCHDSWDEEKAVYVIDSVKAYNRGKMRKAEVALSNLIDKIVEGKKAGLPDDVIKQAQEQHSRAHLLWEYWTAENSDGFHNPDLARASLTKSMDEAAKGIKIIADAMAPKK